MNFLEDIISQFNLKEFIYFISSPELQATLLPVKLIFILFTIFFLGAVIYFMINSSWMQYKFLEDTTEFFLWQSYGEKQITKKLRKIRSRIEFGTETEYKLAIIEAEDFLREVLEERGFESESFEDNVKKAGRLISSMAGDIMEAHEVRNTIVFNPDYEIDADKAKKVLAIYESAINTIGLE